MNGFVLTLNDLNEIIKEEEMDMDEAMQYYFNKRDDSGNRYFIVTENGKNKFKKKKKILSTFEDDYSDHVDPQPPSSQEPLQ